MSTIKTVIIYTFYEFCVGSQTKKIPKNLTNSDPYATLAKLASRLSTPHFYMILTHSMSIDSILITYRFHTDIQTI